MTSHPGPPPTLDLTRDLRDFALLAAREDDQAIEDLLRRGLDWLARIAPYDLATVMELRGDKLAVRMARGRLAKQQVKHHELDLAAFPTLREALETRRPRAFEEHDHAHGDGDPFDRVLDLPHGHACMVVPMVAGDRVRGLLTLDRRVCGRFEAGVIELVEVYAQLLAVALAGAEQRRQLNRLRAQEQERARLLEHELAWDKSDGWEATSSPTMRILARRARMVAATETAVLIRGETGTGKERLACALHAWSQRAQRPFLKLNCAAIPAALLESELFGHVKGAFTGATRDRAGRFQTANGGTLLLDEIGDLSLELQAKLLRILQEGSFEPVGSDQTLVVDVRILAATHVDLEAAVARGTFRADLYYRLNVFPLELPALRERLEDLPLLCAELLNELGARTGKRQLEVSPAGLEHLARHRWPGNVRELANVLERAAILSSSSILGPLDLELPLRGAPALSQPAVPLEAHKPQAAASAPPGPSASALPTLQQLERDYFERLLELCQGRIYGAKGAAERAGLKPTTLQSRLKKLGLSRTGGEL